AALTNQIGLLAGQLPFAGDRGRIAGLLQHRPKRDMIGNVLPGVAFLRATALAREIVDAVMTAILAGHDREPRRMAHRRREASLEFDARDGELVEVRRAMLRAPITAELFGA